MSDVITIIAPRSALILALRVLRHEVSVLDATCGADARILSGQALARRRADLLATRAAYVALTVALGAALDA